MSRGSDEAHDEGDGFPFVSIIVPARNERTTIERCVSALTSQAYPPALLEIIVADGGSTDGTASIVEAVASNDPRVRVVCNDARTTPAGFNAGMRAARGEVLGIMSAHAEAPGDYVRRIVEALSRTGAWCVGGGIDRRGTVPTQVAIARATASPYGVGDAVHNYAGTAQWVDTAFPGMWPRWVIERVGLFDEELLRNQDDELSYRIREAGGRIWFDPSIRVAYLPRSTWRGAFSQYRQYAMWKVRVLQKHPRALRVRHFIPATFLGVLVIGPLSSPIGWAGPLAAGLALTAYASLVAIGATTLDANGTTRLALARAIVTLHLAYGIGFCQGLVRFVPRWIIDRRGVVPRLPAVREPPDPRPRADERGGLGASSASTGDPDARDDDERREDAIRSATAAYRDYAKSGRTQLWTRERHGMLHAIGERDAFIRRALEPALGGTIVDAGCGDGDLAVAVRGWGGSPGRFIGVDLQAERLALARERAPWADFVHGSVDRLPLPDGSASAIVAMTLLSSVPDPWMRRRIVSEFDRVLVSGGRLVVYDIRVPSPANRRIRPVSAGEVRSLLPGWTIVARTLTVLPPLARTRIAGHRRAYRLLHAVPPLRSHVGIVATKP